MRNFVDRPTPQEVISKRIPGAIFINQHDNDRFTALFFEQQWEIQIFEWVGGKQPWITLPNWLSPLPRTNRYNDIVAFNWESKDLFGWMDAKIWTQRARESTHPRSPNTKFLSAYSPLWQTKPLIDNNVS